MSSVHARAGDRRRTRLGAYLYLMRMNASRRDILVAALAGTGFIAIVVTALGSLWRAAAGDGTIGAYDARMLVWYIAAAEVAVVSVGSHLLLDVSRRIQAGEVATLLTRPVSSAWYLVSEELGRSLTRGIVIAAPAGLVALALVGPPPDAPRLLTLVVTLPLAMVLQIIVSVALAGATFWLGDSRALWFLNQKLMFLAGGMLIPLELVPKAGEAFMLLPWASMAYGPSRAAVAAGPNEFARIVALQVAWILVMSLLLHLAFRHGQRRMAVAGG